MKNYTRTPEALANRNSNKFVTMRAIENRRDRLVKRGRNLGFANLLDKTLAALDAQTELQSVITIVDEHDAIQVIEQYS